MTLYDASKVSPAYALRYCWYGWITEGAETTWPNDISARIAALWETDGLRVLSATRRHDQVSILFSTKPHVSPIFLAQRAKGRLDHQLRLEAVPTKFSRKVAVRSLGDNNEAEVEEYIGSQVSKEQFVDPRFEEQMKQFHCNWDNVKLEDPFKASHGRYWYSLHLVLVTDGRYRIGNRETLEKIQAGLIEVRESSSYQYRSLQIMPDHLHLLLRPAIEQSPSDVAQTIQNATSRSVGIRLWKETYYTGTAGVYRMNVIRDV